MNFRKLTSWISASVAFYFLCTAALLLISLSNYEHKWGDYYVVVLLFVINVFIFLNIKAQYSAEKKIPSRELIGYFFLFLVQAVVRVWEISFSGAPGLWLDEITQVQFSQMGILHRSSAMEHQPPLSYMSINFFTFWGGLNDTAARLSVALFSALSGTIAFVLFRHITRTVIVPIILTCLLVFHQYFYQYSIETRPIMIGIFFCLLYVSYLVSLFDEKTLGWPHYSFLTVLGILFLMSLGFQPAVLMVSLFLAISLILFSGFDKKYLYLILSILASVILYIPVQLVIFVTSPSRASAGLPQYFSNLLYNINSENLFLAFNFYPYFFYLFIGFFVLSFAVAVIYKKDISTADAIVFLSSLLFIITGNFIFKTIISYQFNAYYLFLAVPLALISTAYSYKSIKALASLAISNSLIVLLLLYIFISPLGSSSAFVFSDKFIIKDKFKEAYGLIQAKSDNQDYLIQLALPIYKWSPVDMTLGASIYLRANDPERQIRYSAQVPYSIHSWVYDQMKLGHEPRKIFILYFNGWNQVEVNFSKMEKYENYSIFQDLNYFNIVQIDNINKNWKKEWFRILDFIEKNENAEASWVFNTYQIHRALISKDRRLFEKNYNKLIQNYRLPQVNHYSAQIVQSINYIQNDIEITFGQKFSESLEKIK